MKELILMFNEFAEKFGTIEWGGVELALTENPFQEGPLDYPYYLAAAMDKDGDCWRVIWEDVDPNGDWNCPTHAEIMWEGYYLDELKYGSRNANAQKA
jgi:hypothetical protein